MKHHGTADVSRLKASIACMPDGNCGGADWFLYILYSDQEPVYIGVTINVARRVVEHMVGTTCTERKDFTSVEWRTCGPELHALAVERVLIGLHQPQLNKQKYPTVCVSAALVAVAYGEVTPREAVSLIDLHKELPTGLRGRWWRRWAEENNASPEMRLRICAHFKSRQCQYLGMDQSFIGRLLGCEMPLPQVSA